MTLKSRMVDQRILALLFGLWLAGLSVAHADGAAKTRAVHVVVFWFDDGGTRQQRDRVIGTTRGFKDIPGVIDIRVGEPIQPQARANKHPFSIALYIVFENEAALAGYVNHPLHRAAENSGVLSGVQRMEIYDFLDVVRE